MEFDIIRRENVKVGAKGGKETRIEKYFGIVGYAASTAKRHMLLRLVGSSWAFRLIILAFREE